MSDCTHANYDSSKHDFCPDCKNHTSMESLNRVVGAVASQNATIARLEEQHEGDTSDKLTLANEIARLTTALEERDKRIEQMQGEGFCTAAEYLQDWWNQANVRGVATMDGEELVEICSALQQQEQGDGSA